MKIHGWLNAVMLATVALWVTGASAEVYKSRDANGHVVFSQKPPKDGQSEIVTPRYSKPPSQADGAAAPFKPPAQPGAMPSATDASTKPKELTPEQKAAKQKNCEIANERLTQLQHPGPRRLQYKNDKGELAYLTPDMVEERIKDAQAKIAENCEGGVAPTAE
jgi:hypothetical protein